MDLVHMIFTDKTGEMVGYRAANFISQSIILLFFIYNLLAALTIDLFGKIFEFIYLMFEYIWKRLTCLWFTMHFYNVYANLIINNSKRILILGDKQT
jgi:hypothetical protein